MKAVIRTTIGAACIMLASAGVLAQSPAEQKMAWARAAIASTPKDAAAHTELAFALARRARETGNPEFYVEAERALDTALSLAPDHFEALKARAWILLGRHDFARALELARDLNRRVPDDLQLYGFLTDAYAELGRYEEAEGAAQWMLDLRPGNIPGLTRAAYLRELFGDLDGAIELMDAAYTRTPPDEREERAWILTQLGHLHLSSGHPDRAEVVLQQALGLFPGYHYALAALARTRGAQGRHAEAVELQQRRYEAAPHPENLYELARALERAGRRSEAERAFGGFEREARAEMDGVDNANRELVFYYADVAAKPDEALRVARLEAARRQDTHTLHALAWALHASGRHAEARTQMDKALAVGIRDAEMLYHAGAIAAAAGDEAAARGYFEASLAVNGRSLVAPAAREALGRVR